MVFSLFGKKSQSGGAPIRGPAATARPSSGRRIAGVADYFAGAAPDSPGRFASRLRHRDVAADGSSVTLAGYDYGPEVDPNQIESLNVDVDVAPDSLNGWQVPPLRRLSGMNLGPATEAAFTQVPSQLDMEAVPRRRAPLSSRDMPRPVEDCALSFANGQAADALKLIEGAILADDLATWAQQAWLMRFDLYEQLGLKAAFETEALAFAQKFERSPPVWNAHARAAADPQNDSTPTVNVTGQLSAASAAPLSALRKTVNRYPGVRLDFSRLQSADRDGCRYLLVTIQSLKRADKRVLVSSPDVLLGILRPNIRAGDPSTDATMWLLFLELLQLSEAAVEFERCAIDYATTFEVSPPSWQAGPLALVAPPPEPASDDRFYFDGEVVSPAGNLFADLQRYAADRSLVVIDMARLRRIDFVAASQLTSELGHIQAAGHGIEIRSPNEMVSALLVLMGANEVARIVVRRS